MSTLTDVCQICLRTDKKYIFVDKELSEYYNEFTNYLLDPINTNLCLECDHQLKKTYNFKQKCLKAAKILQEWMSTRDATKKSVSQLQTLLPPNPLSIRKQDDSEVHSFCWEEPGPTPRLQGEDSIDTTQNKNIKLENDCEEDSQEMCLQKLITLKREETKSVFQEVFIQNHDSSNDVNKSENIEEDLQYEVEKNESEQNDLIEIPDETSFNSDNDYDFDEEMNRRRRRKKSQIDQDNISLTPDVSDDDEEPKRKKIKVTKKLFNPDDIYKLTSTKEKIIIAKLKTISEDLDTIHENWQKTSLKELPDLALSNDDIDKEIKRSVAKKKMVDKDDSKVQKGKRKGVLAQLESLSDDLDTIHSSCGKIINYKEGLLNPKERLKAELIAKFASCGELKTEKGYTIDKETIMNCFDRISECLMRRLWRFVHGKETLDPMAVRLLKHIQNKYQNEYQYETVFEIEYLNTRDKVMDEFNNKRRTYECYMNAKYKCEKCYLGFKYEAQLQHHIGSHEESAGDFACPVCGVRHKTKKTLDSHSKSHEAVYKCRLCPLVTYYRGSMKNHYHQHQGMQYKCEICDTTFKSKSARQTHLGRYHRDVQARAGALDANETPCAPGGASVGCPQCELRFASRGACERHVRAAHAPQGKGDTLKKVKAERPKKKPIFDCRVCNAVGTSMGWLMVHFSSEHPSSDMALLYADKQKHLCHVCGKGFANVYNMRDHLNLHTGARPFACGACAARFHRSYALAQHRLTHAPPARVCSHCGKRFRSQSNLNNHIKSHIGNRCYKCNVCGKGFLHRNALNEHVRGVHHKMRRVRKRGVAEAGGKQRAASTDASSE